MSPAALRPPMSPMARRVRAYFAPVTRATSAPTIFDPARNAGFALDSPPAPWVDLGWIEEFTRAPATRIQQVRSGAGGAPAAQFRSQLDARVEFAFRQWGKLQMALAGGSQHMNVLASDPVAALSPSGGDPLPAVVLQPGSTATVLQFASGATDAFVAGDLLAVDIGYTGQTGYVGSGIAAAYVSDPADVQSDVDYIRRITFNVGRVVAKTATSITVAQALLGGTPPTGAAVQKVVAFIDREGGSFFQEWSALFVIPEESGGRVCFYYPRLQPAAPTQEKNLAVSDRLEAYALRASFVALPHTDPADSEQVLCYRSYFPASSAALY